MAMEATLQLVLWIFLAPGDILTSDKEEFMSTCFLNNVYLCYHSAHCSHGLQPLDNGIFNVVKAAYRKELSSWLT